MFRHSRKICRLASRARMVFVAGIMSAAIIPGVATAQQDLVSKFQSPPQQTISLFQWSLLYGHRMMLVPVDGIYYPAMQKAGRVIETIPPQLPAILHYDNRKLDIVITTILAPQELHSSTHVMERHIDGEWQSAPGFVFFDNQFYGLAANNTFEAIPEDRIRFQAR